MHKFLFAMVALLIVVAIIPVAVIAFNAPASPPAMASMTAPLRQIT